MGTTWREELAWAAGFFDGEGCTRLNRGYGQMTVRQIDREVLDKFQFAVMNAGHVGGPYKNGKYSSIYQWYACSFQDVQAVSMMLWPFLGEIKKSQIRPVLQGMYYNNLSKIIKT